MKVRPATASRRFRFRLADVICPDTDQVRQEVTSELEVTGELLFLSGSGSQAERFAILRVEGILSPAIVPVERLRPAGWRPEEDRRNAAVPLAEQ